MIDKSELSINQIIIEIKKHIIDNYPSDYHLENLPLSKSLVELDIIDSYGVVQLVLFLEENWKIQINDEEVSKEHMGSINKMANLVYSKLI